MKPPNKQAINPHFRLGKPASSDLKQQRTVQRFNSGINQVKQNRPAAPPVYRPGTVPKVLQPKVPENRQPATPSSPSRPVAPPVYRPQALPRALQPKATGIFQKVVQANAPPAAPAVYRPLPVPKVLQTKKATSNKTSPATPRSAPVAQPVYRPEATKTIQPVIVKGKTSRGNRPIGLKQTNWYNSLPSDTHRAFARAIHENETKKYSISEAQTEILRRIKDKDPVPTFDVSDKEIRRARVLNYINTNAPDPTSTAYLEGDVLRKAGGRAYNRHYKKYRRHHPYARPIRTINSTKPGLYNDQEEILRGLTPWQQIVALTHSKPKSYDLDVSGIKITFDSLDKKSNDDREKERDATELNLAQFFIQQPGGRNSYQKMSDSGDSTLGSSLAHQQLRHLEVERDRKSAVTTYLKDDLLDRGKMTTSETFGDENHYAYQEYKGALRPTSNMARIQTASAYHVLQKALGDANTEIGTQVKAFRQTTPQIIRNALNAFMRHQNETNYRRLVKEIYRLIRVRTRQEQNSDTESDSDSDYP